MQIRHACSRREVATMTTAELRENFLIESLFALGEQQLVYSHYDRTIIGGVMPGANPLVLTGPDDLKADYFLERREVGIINVGGTGKITAGGTVYELSNQDCLYIGKGVVEVQFESVDSAQPARFFLLSAPAHQAYPTQHMAQADATPARMGAVETANKRTIYKYIHLDGIKSCQIVMGLTQLEPGSVWNTMPPHTHDRRMEAYLYFDLPADQRVLHLMGEPEQTRNLWVAEGQAIISPPWSIHAGCGTTRYAFIWGMAGENQSFADMDQVALPTLR